jgi:hypothetical protein
MTPQKLFPSVSPQSGLPLLSNSQNAYGRSRTGGRPTDCTVGSEQATAYSFRRRFPTWQSKIQSSPSQSNLVKDANLHYHERQITPMNTVSRRLTLFHRLKNSSRLPATFRAPSEALPNGNQQKADGSQREVIEAYGRQIELRDSAGRPVRVPSPWGEGKGEGDRDLLTTTAMASPRVQSSPSPFPKPTSNQQRLTIRSICKKRQNPLPMPPLHGIPQDALLAGWPLAASTAGHS